MLRLGRINKHLGPRGEGGPTSSGWKKKVLAGNPLLPPSTRGKIFSPKRGWWGRGVPELGGKKLLLGALETSLPPPPPARVVASGINSMYACSELFDPQLIANRIETDTIVVRPSFNQQPIVCRAAV